MSILLLLDISDLPRGLKKNTPACSQVKWIFSFFAFLYSEQPSRAMRGHSSDLKSERKSRLQPSLRKQTQADGRCSQWDGVPFPALV